MCYCYIVVNCSLRNDTFQCLISQCVVATPVLLRTHATDLQQHLVHLDKAMLILNMMKLQKNVTIIGII